VVDVVRETGLRCRLDDGVELVADAWRPAAGGPWPVLLQRLPYGRAVASTPVLPHPSWFARHGYAVVAQDCRGRGDSGGAFAPFVHEGADGAASIEWAARLPFADGRVATYGFSYQGLAQLYAAARRPPSLRAIAPMMCCPDPFEGWTYDGGLLRWPFVCFWAAQLAGQELGRPPVPFDPGALPIADALGTAPPPWFGEWLAHPRDDAYWAARRPDLEAIDVPAFTVGGWFDDFASGTAEVARRLGAEVWFGPWAHMPWGTVHGGAELGDAASPAPVWDALVRFFDRAFAGDRPGPGAHYHVIGEGWRSAPAWPPPTAHARWWGRSPTGNAASRWGDGVLEPDAGGPVDIASTLVVEPLVPHPGAAPDFDDEAAAHDRRDVLCYTSAPLTDALVTTGSATVRCVTRCDRPRHDLVASLSLVDVAGRARVLTVTGARRLDATEPGTEHRWELRLRPVSVRVGAGERLRLSLSGNRFPCYDRNAHTAQHDPATPADAHVVATVEVRGVTLDLPIEPASRAAQRIG
jgi:hypothetical protein